MIEEQMTLDNSYLYKGLLVAVIVSTGLCAAGVVDYPQMVELKETDSPEDIIEKAASVRPSPRQLEYHQEEFIAFLERHEIPYDARYLWE